MGKLWRIFALSSIAIGAVSAQTTSSQSVQIPIGYWNAPQHFMLNGSEASHSAGRVTGRAAASSSPEISTTTSTTAAGATAPLNFVAITPCRIMDTRLGSSFTGAFGPPELAADTPRTIPVPTSSCGVPASAAYSLNFTLVPPCCPPTPVGFLSAYPTTFQNTSVLNSPTGQIIANGAVIPADSSGNFIVMASDPTDLVIDINGYYVPDTTTLLATAFSGLNYTIAPVSGTGVDPGTHVAVGATTTLTANYSLGGALESGQIVIGIEGQATAQGCLFDYQAGEKAIVANTGTVHLIAPGKPGIYYIGVRSATQSSCTNALAGNQYDGIIASLTVY